MAERVLIVDDAPVQRRLLENMATKAGYETTAVDGGEAALALMLAADGPPPDCVVLDLVMPDLDGLETEAREARADGFHGKMAIHPNQVEAINRAFAISAEERAWAESVVAAFAREPGKGVVKLDGRMIDQPHLKLAQRIVGA